MLEIYYFRFDSTKNKNELELFNFQYHLLIHFAEKIKKRNDAQQRYLISNRDSIILGQQNRKRAIIFLNHGGHVSKTYVSTRENI